MGLDAVEIVLRAEDLFGIDIPAEEAESIRTVGDFYRLICAKLGLPPLQDPVTPDELPVLSGEEKSFLFLGRLTPLPPPPEVLPWSPQSVWDCLITIFADEQGLKANEITYHSRISQDLGLD